MTEKILTAITKPKEVPEIMHEMAGVTFVQSVESAALAMVVPLLLRGLREKSIATKRQSAVIINNMSKLVDNPVEAAPFLPLLLPALRTFISPILVLPADRFGLEQDHHPQARLGVWEFSSLIQGIVL